MIYVLFLCNHNMTSGIDALTGSLFVDGICVIGGFVLGVIVAIQKNKKKAIAQKKLESLK